MSLVIDLTAAETLYYEGFTPECGLTMRQWQVYSLILKHFLEFGRMPTIRELGKALDIKSPNGIISILNPLAKKGWIVRQEKMSRAVDLLNLKPAMVLVEGHRNLEMTLRQAKLLPPLPEPDPVQEAVAS